ncbi:MAG TPA: FG-GAP-like repeat-containing protein [Candidatus Dormibacteraeota bacterium]|nr:FG-GAP-like repeat-containing protein [Candidatus Dormibacteraeota bacterium]
MRIRRSWGAFAVVVVSLGLSMALAWTPYSGAMQTGNKAAAPKKNEPTGNTAEAVRLNTLGVAYMNQQKFAEAQKYFDQAMAADSSFGLARLNLGISLLAQQKLEPARAALEEATRKLRDDPFGWYNLGLAYKDMGESEKGLEALAHVSQIAPSEPDAFYFTGYLNSQLQRYDAAIAAFQKALELQPYHASAEFGLARAYQRKGDAESARKHLARFQKITTEHIGAPFGAGYGDQGKYSLAELFHGAAMAAPAAINVKYTVQPVGAATSVGPSTGACFIDYDNDGKPDLFLVSASADGVSKLVRNSGNGSFEDVTEKAGIKLKGSGLGCAAGDFDNDGRTDLAVCLSDGVHLLRNTEPGKFEEVTEKVGIQRGKDCVSVSFVDYDHDGDLDLYVTSASANGEGGGRHNVLWRNNGNSTFTDVSTETGLGVGATSGGVVTSDFNNDRAVDFVFAGGTTGAAIYLNPREGKFSALAGIDFKKENLPPAVGVVALDFDKDGWMDLAFTYDGAPGISLWRNVEGKGLQRVALPELGWTKGWGLAAVDYDNDSWLDLVAVGEGAHGGEIRLLRNQGTAGWSDVTKNVHLDQVKLTQPRAIAVADWKGDGSPDLVVTQLGGAPVFLKNEGANQNNWMRLELKPLNDNKSGIGTKVEIYAGPLYQKWEVAGASGYLSQNAGPILVGLGKQTNADLVRLLWPTGVPQDEVNLAARKSQSVAELDRRGSSCPVLFAWNGSEYEFIADMLGPGVVGHWVAPGERDVPDSTEYLKVGAKSVRAKNGLLSFRFMEPMEETVYLDQVRLLAIDHPVGVEVNPNERFVSAPPFPEFRVIASRDARVPAGAWDDRGNDVLALLSRRDRKYVTGFDGQPFAGFAKLHYLELDLGEWDANKPLRLLMDGYTDYFTATSMYAADQAGIKVIAPYVEALDASGKWVRVIEDLGFPAGMERTMIAEMSGKIPAGTRRIRIWNNLEIYWDAVRIDQTPEVKDVRVSEVPLARAALDFFGFPRETKLKPASDVVYSFTHRSATGPYARAAGSYTRYGDVHDLLRAADNRFAVFSSGEGVKLDFDPAKLPPLPAGWVRDYFFFADGFEKDLDFYAAHAFTVEPLPRHASISYPYPAGQEYPEDAEHQQYRLEYNTRTGSGRMPASLRYDYAKPN